MRPGEDPFFFAALRLCGNPLFNLFDLVLTRVRGTSRRGFPQSRKAAKKMQEIVACRLTVPKVSAVPIHSRSLLAWYA